VQQEKPELWRFGNGPSGWFFSTSPNYEGLDTPLPQCFNQYTTMPQSLLQILFYPSKIYYTVINIVLQTLKTLSNGNSIYKYLYNVNLISCNMQDILLLYNIQWSVLGILSL